MAVSDVPQGNVLGEESSLSSWAGPYVTNMLGRGAALSNMPYTAYEGPLTAGPSALQTQAFQGLGALNIPTSGSFTAPGTAATYMSPYLKAALDPQITAARRQAEISAQNLQTQYGKAGAYGGSRQGVAEAELQRGLLDRLAGIYGTGYENAFQRAQDQFNTEQRYGLDALREQLAGGKEERAIEQQGVLADIAQFEQERDYPMQQLKFMQSLLGSGVPLETQTYSYYEPTGLQSLLSGATDVVGIYDLVKKFITPTATGQTDQQKNFVQALIDSLNDPVAG
jgi:hypothetical protein